MFGNIRTSNTVRYISVNSLRRVDNFDELTYHFLATIAMHLGTGTKKAGAGPAGSPLGMVSNDFGQHSNPAGGSGMSAIQQAVLAMYVGANGTGAGLHSNSVVQAMRGKYSEGDVRASVHWLMNEGYLYQTIDNDHAKATTAN